MDSIAEVVNKINQSNEKLIAISTESSGDSRLYLLTNTRLATVDSNEIYGLRGIHLQHYRNRRDGHYDTTFVNAITGIYTHNEKSEFNLTLGDDAILSFICQDPVWSKVKLDPNMFFGLAKQTLSFIDYGR